MKMHLIKLTIIKYKNKRNQKKIKIKKRKNEDLLYLKYLVLLKIIT
jgi:hypothetical protein